LLNYPLFLRLGDFLRNLFSFSNFWNYRNWGFFLVLRTIRRRRLSKEISDLLWHGKITKPLSILEAIIREYHDNPDINRLIEFKTYIENNREWIIDYEEARNNGYYVGSSIMEGAIRLGITGLREIIMDRSDGPFHFGSIEGYIPGKIIEAGIKLYDRYKYGKQGDKK